jgi:hypothetical protein
MYDTITTDVPRILWDKDYRFKNNDFHHNVEIKVPPQIKNFPEWRMCRYLPFFDEKGYMSGLTMHCSGNGITGMTATGLSARSIGLCSGVSIHLHFQQNERIVSLWIRMPGDGLDIDSEPNIMVRPYKAYILINANTIRLRLPTTKRNYLGHPFTLLHLKAGTIRAHDLAQTQDP